MAAVTTSAVPGTIPRGRSVTLPASSLTSRFVWSNFAGVTGTAQTNCRISRSALSSSAAWAARHSSAATSPAVRNRLFTADHRKPSVSVCGSEPSITPSPMIVCPSCSSLAPALAATRSSLLQTWPHDGQANALVFTAACFVSAPCQPVRCSRSGTTQAWQCGQGRTIRLLLPLEYSCHVRPVSVLTVHSMYTRFRDPYARVRASICVILSDSRLVCPGVSMPSVSVMTITRDVNPARLLSLPPPLMNFSVGPWRNWRLSTRPPRLPPP
jgi:hypothetical protein